MNNRFDIYPAKGSFELNEAISFRVKNDGEAQLIALSITSVEALSCTRRIRVESGISTITLSDCYFPLGGYRVEAQFFQNGRMTDICFTAFDVIQPGTIIRYGFLCDFSATDDADNDVEAMLQMHINAVQFYDWSYRHDELVAPVTDYYDMMGKHNNLSTIRRKIQACHERGMKALAYGAVYAASESYQKQHPEQSLYNGQGKPLCFINTFYIMNLSDPSAWQRHILNQYQRAMDEVGFDGIHMDTYGSPKVALGADREIVYLDDEFPKLIEMAHLLPLKSKKPPFLIFNNVGGWPAERTMCTNQQAVYIEVWPPYVQYYHLSTMIETAKKSGKPVILAAYPAAFRTDTPERALESQLLLSFVIGMHGATQLFFGEENAVITQGYYVDYTRLNGKQIEWIRSYQDFFVQYESIFMDRSLENVSLSHQGWDNQEYQFVPSGSADGESGKVWYHLLQNHKRKVVCIVNLSNNSSVWNEGKRTPDEEVMVSAKIQVTREPEAVWVASPDYQHGKQQQLSYQLMQTEQSAVIYVKLQVLRCGILVIDGG